MLQQAIHQQLDAADVNLLFGIEINVRLAAAGVKHFGEREGEGGEEKPSVGMDVALEQRKREGCAAATGIVT